MNVIYRTKDVVRLTGVSPRQAQWWTEQGVIAVQIEGHLREWSSDQVLMVFLVQELRRKGLSLNTIRKLRKKLEQVRSDYFVTNGMRGEWVDSEADVISWFQQQERAGVLVFVRDFRERLRNGTTSI